MNTKIIGVLLLVAMCMQVAAGATIEKVPVGQKYNKIYDFEYKYDGEKSLRVLQHMWSNTVREVRFYDAYYVGSKVTSAEVKTKSVYVLNRVKNTPTKKGYNVIACYEQRSDLKRTQHVEHMVQIPKSLAKNYNIKDSGLFMIGLNKYQRPMMFDFEHEKGNNYVYSAVTEGFTDFCIAVKPLQR